MPPARKENGKKGKRARSLIGKSDDAGAQPRRSRSRPGVLRRAWEPRSSAQAGMLGRSCIGLAIAAGLEEIDVLECEASDDNGAMRSMIENAAHEPLNPVDQWRGMERLVSLGWTEEAIAAALGLAVLHRILTERPDFGMEHRGGGPGRELSLRFGPYRPVARGAPVDRR
jgi:hypothetical protein